jgi:hypothetical protein
LVLPLWLCYLLGFTLGLSEDPAAAFLELTSTLAENQALDGVVYPPCVVVSEGEVLSAACGWDPYVGLERTALPYPEGTSREQGCRCWSNKRLGFCDCGMNRYKTINNVVVDTVNKFSTPGYVSVPALLSAVRKKPIGQTNLSEQPIIT